MIRSAGIAVFELVKNAYDADAKNVVLTMRNLEDPANAVIEVEDDGSGMTWATVTGVWLEPGSGHKEAERVNLKRTPIFHRLPLGEKGVGRFAAHKLGSKVSLVTRAAGEHEVGISVDWDDFAQGGYLDEIRNTVVERSPLLFKGNKTGTRITIRGLRQAWTRSAMRDLARAINSIQSPFESDESFRIKVSLPEQAQWLAGILNVRDVLKSALYEVHGTIEKDTFTYTYNFKPRPAMRLKGRMSERSIRLAVPAGRGKRKASVSLDLSKHQIGPVNLDLFIYDFDPKVLQFSTTDRQGLKDYLGTNGGIRVYRDGVRVFDYAEPGNDWLDLEGRRINRPGLHLSNNLVLGAVALNRETSGGLVEKTNREGFVENAAFLDLVQAVQSAIVQVEAERKQDKDRLRQLGGSPKRAEPILEDIGLLLNIAEQRGVADEVAPILKRIERDYIDIRDTLLTSASAGLSLTMVIHEVEKGLLELKHAIDVESHIPQRIRQVAKHLADLVEGLGAIARKSGNSTERASDLISQAVFNTELRMEYHKVKVRVELEDGDFSMKCSRHLTIATIMNLMDNSIWWLDHEAPTRKEIRIFTSRSLSDGPSIVVADNNTLGFIDPEELVTRPFFTRKPGGMGLGLHLADEVMKAQRGSFRIISASDVGIPKQFKAVVALTFPEAKWSV